MAISTYKTYLMKGTGTTPTWSKLLDIKSFPDLGGDPETIDVTTLSDPMRVFIEGIQNTGNLQFTANYTSADYAAIAALKGQSTKFAVWFGASTSNEVDTPDGSRGKFDFEGTISAYVTGGGVNEAVSMNVTVVPSTKISFTAGT